MKVVIQVDDTAEETVVTIRCRELSNEILSMQRLLTRQEDSDLLLFQEGVEYYLPMKDILFFETSQGTVQAHLATQSYDAEYKLYELEQMLPYYFMRISKSTIVNLYQILAIQKNLTSASRVTFSNSVKQCFVSRSYYKAMEERMHELRIRKR